jgi:O-antigen/teichoic acid export membrane protein
MHKSAFFFANAIQLGLRFLQMIVIIRNLSSVDLGLYYASAAYPQLLSRIFDLGLPHAARFYLLRFPNQALFLGKLIAVFSLTIFPFIAFIFLFLDRLPMEADEISMQISQNWIVLSIYCLLLILNTIINGLIISIEKYKALLFAFTLPYVIFILIILYKANVGALSVNDILLQLMISELIVLIIYVTAIAKFFVKLNEVKSKDFRWKDVMIYALKIYPNGVLKTMTTRLDRVVLSLIATPAFIGHYSVLMTLRDIATIPITTYGQTFMNELSNSLKSGRAGIRKLVDKNLLWILVIYTLGFFIFVLFQDFFLKLLFRELTDGNLYTMSLVLMISAIPNVLLAFIHYFFLAANKPLHISVSSAIAAISFYGFVILAHQKIGSDSFFYASLVSALIGFSYLFLHSRALLKTWTNQNL